MLITKKPKPFNNFYLKLLYVNCPACYKQAEAVRKFYVINGEYEDIGFHCKHCGKKKIMATADLATKEIIGKLI